MSNMFSGTNHDNKRSPLVTAGSLGGTLETGHALNFFDAGDQH